MNLRSLRRTKEWESNRLKKLRESPLCEVCGSPATTIHHPNQSHSAAEYITLIGTQALCGACHLRLHRFQTFQCRLCRVFLPITLHSKAGKSCISCSLIVEGDVEKEIELPIEKSDMQPQIFTFSCRSCGRENTTTELLTIAPDLCPECIEAMFHEGLLVANWM